MYPRRSVQKINRFRPSDVESYGEDTEEFTRGKETRKKRRSLSNAQHREIMKEDETEFSVIPTSKRGRENSANGKFQYDSEISPRRSTMSLGSAEKKRQRRRSRTRRSEENIWENDIGHVGKEMKSSTPKISDHNFSKKSREKIKRDTSDRNELPITEILKKSHERAKYDKHEPLALPKLTTDTIYVQGKNGFSAMKIQKERVSQGNKFTMSGECDSRPIKIAIITQKAWRYTGLVYQGLLGGMALMHFILMQTFFQDSSSFVSKYVIVSEIYTNFFSFLIAMCVVAVFDKFDIAHLDLEHLCDIYANHAKSALAIFLYVSSFCLHQVTLRINDKLSLINYNVQNGSLLHTNKNETYSNTLEDELPSWHKVTLSKDILVVLAWIFVSFETRDDMLLSNLEGMAYSAENCENLPA